MKSRKHVTAVWGLASLALGALSACGGGGGNGGGTPAGAAPNANNKPPANAAVTVKIDATAGGFGTPPGDPANKYTYFNLDTGQVVDISDTDAAASGAWHMAFKRANVNLNGGVSGPGAARGAVADAQDDFYDAASGDPDVSVFTNATPDSELAAFEAVTSADGLAFAEDRYIPSIRGDGTADGWWLYSGPPAHTVSANPDQWWLIKSAAGDSYAKFHVTNIVQASRDITLDLFIQSAAASAFSTTATTWTAAIGAAGGSKCFDIDTAAEVDCATAAADWDIKVEVAGRAWNIWTNGGVSGNGGGGAFGPFDTAGAAGYVSGASSPGGRDIRRMYRQDSVGGIFKDSTWYAYSLQKDNKLWPNYRVYAVDTGTGFFKVQLLSYYDQAGVSGNYTVRYAPLTGTSSFETVSVALSEWAVTPDKPTVSTGPVSFSVTNNGPADSHEFVVIKTDLAPDSLPVDADGNVDESGAGITIIGEIEGIAVGEDAQTTFDLEPGKYVLICNIWDAGEQEAHYSMGMRSAFTVQ